MATRDRARMREGLRERTEESYRQRDNYGRFKTYFEDGLEIPFWRPKDGRHSFNVIPYVAGPNDPVTKEGHPTYILEIWTHTKVGVNDDQFLCLAQNYKQACPICEELKRVRDDDPDNKDLIDQLKPKRRVIYNVVVMNSRKDEEEGVKVFEISHYFMERLLVPLAKKPRDGGTINFADPDEGMMISFERKSSKDKVDVIGHRLDPRDREVYDEEMDAAFVLDELVHIPTYQEVEEAFYGVKVEGEAPAKEARPTRERAPAQEEERPARERERTSRPRDEEPEERPTRERSRPAKDEPEEKPRERIRPRSEPAEAPRERSRPTREPEPEPDYASDARDPEPEPEEASDTRVDDRCPSKHNFGVDIEKKPECSSCSVWDDCAAEADKLEEEAKTRRSEGRRSRRDN